MKLEAFESLAPFQKKLEELYLAIGRDQAEPLYYERRSKQYDHLAIGRERIITLATQINCFVAMFLNEPHSTHRYYGELLSSYRSRLFSDSHSPLLYYVSGVALARVERLFAEGRMPRTWKSRKYQLMMVYRLQNQETVLPALNNKNIEKYCDVLLEKLNDNTRIEDAFHRAGELVESAREGLPPLREPPERTRAYTNALMAAASSGAVARVATAARTSGTVKSFSEIRGYGFISNDDGGSAFVHYTGIAGRGYRNLVEGQRVEYTIMKTSRGSRAIDVEVI